MYVQNKLLLTHFVIKLDYYFYTNIYPALKGLRFRKFDEFFNK